MGKVKIINDTISNFVKDFLVSNNIDSSVIESWSSDDNQKLFEKTIKTTKKKEEKKEEKKKSKHKDEPKRASSSYICFCKGERSNIKSKFNNLNNQEIMAKLGEVWNTLTDSDKNKWNKESEKDKERYKKELEKFYKDHPECVEKTQPKKPLSAYVLFCNANRQEVRNKNPDLNPTGVMSLLGKLWKETTDKTEWNNLAEKDKERYKKETSSDSTPVIEEPLLDVIEEEEEEVLVVEEKPKKKKPATKKEKKEKK